MLATLTVDDSQVEFALVPHDPMLLHKIRERISKAAYGYPIEAELRQYLVFLFEKSKFDLSMKRVTSWEWQKLSTSDITGDSSFSK